MIMPTPGRQSPEVVARTGRTGIIAPGINA
jgi:hypothetical protein